MSTLSVNTITDTSGGTTTTINGFTPTVSNMAGRNRIINGDMRIDQRNAGASVSFNSSSNFPVDRWKTYNTVGSGSTAQRSTTAPAGFNNSLLFTVGTGASPGAADECRFFQPIEGFNVTDLGWGTADAQAVTISFRVRSSITGTYAFNLRNDAGNRSYVATYTVDAANTFETKTITVPGDTSGTWATNNSTGIMLRFDLGSGSNANTTAGAWQAGNFGRTSACVNWIATNGATFYITGVQLEAGSVATPFEHRQYGQELALCQRYYAKLSAGGYSNYCGFSVGIVSGTTTIEGFIKYPVAMRAAATLNYSNVRTNTGSGTNAAVSSLGATYAGTDSMTQTFVSSGSSMTTGQAATIVGNNNSSAYLELTAEL